MEIDMICGDGTNPDNAPVRGVELCRRALGIPPESPKVQSTVQAMAGRPDGSAGIVGIQISVTCTNFRSEGLAFLNNKRRAFDLNCKVCTWFTDGSGQ